VRIQFVCNEYPPAPHGGIGTLTRTLARGLAAAGHGVSVAGVYRASASAAGSNQEADAGAARVDVLRLPASTGRGGWIRSRARLWRHVARRARAGEIDLVEAPDWEGWTAAWPELPVPVVVRLSGASSYFAAEMGKRPARSTFWLERSALRRADFVCAESRYVAEATRRVFGLERPVDAVLYNPVDLSGPATVLAAARSPRRIVFAGTLTEKKGIFSLADAWPLVLARRPDATLDVYGRDTRGADGGSVLARLEARKLRGVRFLGQVPLEDLVAVFAAARAAVLPSYAEGFSLTPLHAMETGCPVIGTARGSGPEAIEDGVTGVLVDPGRPAEIAAAILRVLEDDGVARALGERGRRSVHERFSLPAVLGANEEFYRECLAAFARAGRAA
jgi:glycosyltransferase involved in cell wall biosynthesis